VIQCQRESVGPGLSESRQFEHWVVKFGHWLLRRLDGGAYLAPKNSKNSRVTPCHLDNWFRIAANGSRREASEESRRPKRAIALLATA
jgi:hypothetical protein